MPNIEPKPSDGFTSSEFPKNSKVEDIVKGIIEKRLGKSNLLLAIIETVTISRIQGIGETICLAYKSVDYIKKTIHKDYKDIIDEIKETSFGSPIKYYNWYERDSHYYVIHKNENFLPLTYNTLNGHPITPELKNKDEKYIEDFDKVITDEELDSFYKKYTSCFLSKNWFKELPNYFILAKPIAIQDKQTKSHIPLGNLYVTIGTVTEVGIDIYQELVKDLRSFWFHKYGDTILKEYSLKKRSNLYKPKLEQHPNLSKKFKEVLFTLNAKPITFDDLYYYAFDLDYTQTFIENEAYLLYSDHNLIEIITKQNPINKNELIEFINTSFLGYSKNDPINFIKCNKKKLKDLNSIGTEGIKYFLQLLSKRRFALMLLYVYELSEEETHMCITHGNREYATATPNTTIYLRENLFIYPGGFAFNEKLLSDKERLFLENVVFKIKEKHPDFTCKNFN